MDIECFKSGDYCWTLRHSNGKLSATVLKEGCVLEENTRRGMKEECSCINLITAAAESSLYARATTSL